MADRFWKNKRVLITGYEGFLGSHLTKALLEQKAWVCGLDILTYRKSTILYNDFDKLNIIKGSVENYKLVSDIIRDNKIEFIFHLAAKSLVGGALRNPRGAFSTNIRGTWNILEASRQARTVKAIIIASSDKAYGIKNKLPYRENSSLTGCHPYDVSKSCADLLAYTYFHTYGLPVCITRCGNIYGPGDFNFSRIVPDAIRSIIKNQTLLIRSDGKFVRDYIYIKDIVLGYLLLAKKMNGLKLYGEAFNFSDENPITVIELVKRIYKLLGKKENYKILNLAKFEIRYQYLASAKARRVLNWKPKVTLDDGLRRTIAWYRDFLQG
jgi:CDP-glucose 4,6-dehydratase